MTARPRSADAAGSSGRRRAARLAAVQALYQVDLTGASCSAVVEEWRRHRLGKEDGEIEASTGSVDRELFTDIVEGAWGRREDIDGMIRPALAAGWTLQRLEVVLRAILRAGVYELVARSDVPARVAIDEYIEIAHGFFAGREPAFVNGVLDGLARRLRPTEFADALPSA